MPRMPQRLELTLRGSADLEPASRRVREFLREGGIDDRRSYHADLAIEEIVVNVLRHGARGGPKGPIGLTVELDAADGVLLTFADDEHEFDPWSLPAPDVNVPLDERKVGGLGVHLVRTLARRVAYERKGGRNETRVWI